jgi:ribokinase
MTRRAARIAVLGSINMDLVIRCRHLPVPGETVIAHSSAEVPGGKGANQAVAASRLGADVTMIGSVGDDAFASRLLQNLSDEQIDVSQVTQRTQCASGLAVVAVEDAGENLIAVVPGANASVSVEDALRAKQVIRHSDVLLLQLEIPHETVIAAMRLARELKTRVILDPAPATASFPSQLFDVDVLCPNQSEAALILDREVRTIDEAKAAAVALNGRGVRHAIVTLGAQGAVLSDGKHTQWIEPFSVDAVDTTAAGDAFAGALAVAWKQAPSLAEAVRFASAAGALAATRAGAQPGMPQLEEVHRLVATTEG